MPRTFGTNWEPSVLSEEIVERGTWLYDGEVPMRVELVCHRWNYRKADLEALEAMEFDFHVAEEINPDINEQGETFIWSFLGSDGRVTSLSPQFGSASAARQHMRDVYGSYTKLD